MNDKYINPNNLLLSLEKRGYFFDEALKKKYNNIYKNYKNGLYKNVEDIQENLDKNEEKLFNLFSILNNYNKEYTIYILILCSLHYVVLKNLYRFLMINWFKFQNSFSSRKSQYTDDEINKITNKKFNNTVSEINCIKKENVLDMFIDNLSSFVNHDKVFLLYFINIMQEYLCP